MDRIDIVFELIDRKGRGLEIGPSYRPLAAKADGFNIATVDHADQQTLIAKYSAKSVPPERIAKIEEVDYVWSGEPLSELIDEKFDYILASHFIEHTVDLIEFLDDCEKLLVPGGTLSLIIPDKRFCFDAWRPLTTVGQVVDAHLRDGAFHSPGTVIDKHAYSVRRSGRGAWGIRNNTGPITLTQARLTDSMAIIEMAMSQEEYIDGHHWQFTPTSFSLILEDLRDLGYTKFIEASTHGTVGSEFYVSLQVGTVNPPRRDRTALLQQISDELSTEAAQLRKQLDAVYATPSWKVTKPLRGIKKLAKGKSKPKPKG